MLVNKMWTQVVPFIPRINNQLHNFFKNNTSWNKEKQFPWQLPNSIHRIPILNEGWNAIKLTASNSAQIPFYFRRVANLVREHKLSSHFSHRQLDQDLICNKSKQLPWYTEMIDNTTIVHFTLTFRRIPQCYWSTLVARVFRLISVGWVLSPSVFIH